MAETDWQPSGFDVMKQATEAGRDIKCYALGHNFLRAKYHKGQTEITIVAEGNVVQDLVDGRLVGGLVLLSKDAWLATLAELKAQHGS